MALARVNGSLLGKGCAPGARTSPNRYTEPRTGLSSSTLTTTVARRKYFSSSFCLISPTNSGQDRCLAMMRPMYGTSSSPESATSNDLGSSFSSTTRKLTRSPGANRGCSAGFSGSGALLDALVDGPGSAAEDDGGRGGSAGFFSSAPRDGQRKSKTAPRLRQMIPTEAPPRQRAWALRDVGEIGCIELIVNRARTSNPQQEARP